MVALPGGTVTLLFSDIEGSTPLVRHLSDRYVEVQAEHHRLLAGAIAAAGGAVVDTQGDGCFAAFPGARAALRAAVAAQRALADHPWPDGIAVGCAWGCTPGSH